MRNRLPVNGLAALCTVSVVFILGLAAPALPWAAESRVADAAMKGDIETARSLLREGADVNAAQGDGLTALHWAALNDDVAMMRVLLYAGANLEATTRLGGYTPLHLASMEGRAAAVAALSEAGANVEAVTDTGVSPLHLAAQAGRSDSIRALLGAGADVNARDVSSARTPLIFATAHNRLAAMETLLEAGADPALATKLIDYPSIAEKDGAARATRQRVVAAAKPPEPGTATAGRGGRGGQRRPSAPGAPGRGNEPPPDPDDPPARVTPPDPDDPPARVTPPDPDDPPGTPRRDPGPPSTGGRGGADPPAGEPRSLSTTEQIGIQGGMTALHYATRDGRAEAAMLLLEAGTDINLPTGGDKSTPLLVAVINGNFDLAKELLARGADPNLASEDGVAPLFATINNEWHLRTWYPQPTAQEQQRASYLDLMRALLDAGADPDAQTTSHVWYAAYNAGRMGVDFTGATAFWRAAYAMDVAAMRLLVEYGADPNISTVALAGGRNRFRFFGNRTRPPGRGRPVPGAAPDASDDDPSGLPPSHPGDPAVHPLLAASGVGFGTSRVGQQHRHVPDGWMPAVRYLVEELGVDVNVRDHQGYSAVHNAASRGDNEMIEFLVEHGADVTFVSRRGQTTVDMANGPQQRVQPFPETIALLESLGATNNNNCISCD